MKAGKFTADYELKLNCREARCRHRRYWQGGNTDSPLLHIKARISDDFPALPIDPGKSRRELDFDLNWHINYCRSHILRDAFLFDSMPIAPVMFGRDITLMGVLSGHDFAIHPETEFITFNPSPDFLFSPTPDFSPASAPVKNILAIYQGLCADIGNLACVNPPTTADALTTMAMILGTEDFLTGLYRHPAAIIDKALALNKLFYRFYDYIYSYLLGQGYGEAASWFPVFAEGKFDSLRADIAVMLSEKMFKEVCLPVLEDACSYLDYAMFNLDSVRLIPFITYLAKIKGLNGVYWNIEPWLRAANDYLPALKQVRDAGLLVVLPCRDLAEAKQAIDGLGKGGLLLEFPPFADIGAAGRLGEAVTDYAARCLY